MDSSRTSSPPGDDLKVVELPRPVLFSTFEGRQLIQAGRLLYIHLVSQGRQEPKDKFWILVGSVNESGVFASNGQTELTRDQDVSWYIMGYADLPLDDIVRFKAKEGEEEQHGW